MDGEIRFTLTVNICPAVAGLDQFGAAAYEAARRLGASPDENEEAAEEIWRTPWRGTAQGGQ